MSDIHQEWKELRQKNGDFINHLDGEMAKLKQDKQLQDLLDAGAFAMHFVAPPPFNCCQDDRDILKALNKAQADRIKYLEDEFLACKEQQRVDQAVKKDLDEKLDKATADYRALWVENDRLKSQLAGAKAQCENTVENRRRISELSQEVIDLRVENAALQKEANDFMVMYDKAAAEAHQAHVAKDRMGYSNRCMQSKIAKQANEINRLAHENAGLVIDIRRHKDEIDKLKQGRWDEMERLQNAKAKLEYDNFQLKQALGTSAKDADANFERGKVKGMEEIWSELKDTYANRSLAENEKIFGYATVGDIVDNLSPTWFINKAEEYHEQQAKDIQIGDEVEVTDEAFLDPGFSDIGIVIAVYPERRSFKVIGPKFEGCFDETDIQSGRVKKTGQHFESIPLAYFA